MAPLLVFGAYAVMLFVVMYLFVYVPNKKKQKKMQAMHDSLVPGDEVITLGGIVGKVVSRDDEYVTLCIDEEKQVNMQVVIYAVSQVKGKNA